MARVKVKLEKAGTLPDRAAAAPASETRPSASGAEFVATTPAAPWAVAFCVLSIFWLALVWWPISRIPVHYAIDYNEGLSSYRVQGAVSGPPLYGTRPTFVYNDYPSLSFHLIGWLARTADDVNLTGRWASLLAYLLIAGFAAMIVQRLSGSWRCGTFSALCWLIWLAAFDPTRIGFNDPHM